MVFPVIPYGDPVLRRKGEPVVKFDDELKKLAGDMVETLQGQKGIGLAAQQVGKVLQLFIVDVRPRKGEEQDFRLELDGKVLPADVVMPIILVNAKIEALDGEECVYREGCLSFPGIFGEVVRPESVRVKYQDVEGTAHVLECSGLLARCCQHENDHCQGVVFVDRMEPRARLRNAAKIKALKRDTIAELKEKKHAKSSGNAETSEQ